MLVHNKAYLLFFPVQFVIEQRQGQVVSFEVFDKDPGEDDKLGK